MNRALEHLIILLIIRWCTKVEFCILSKIIVKKISAVNEKNEYVYRDQTKHEILPYNRELIVKNKTRFLIKI